MSQIAERPVVLAPAEPRREPSQPASGERPTPRPITVATVRDWWRRHPDLAWLSLILVIGLLVRLALLYRVPPLFMPGDSQSFLTPAYDLARGLGFDPILKRALGYPLLVAAVIATLGEDLRGLIFVQATLGLVTVAATYWIGRLAFGRVTGALAALSVAIGGQLLIYEHYILAESVFAMLLALAVLGLVAAAQPSPPGEPSPPDPLSRARGRGRPSACRTAGTLQSGSSSRAQDELLPSPSQGRGAGDEGSPAHEAGGEGCHSRRSGDEGSSATSRLWLAAAGGVALAAASLFRPIAEVMVPLLPVYFLAAVKPPRRALMLTAVAIVGFVATMAPAFVADLALRGGASSGALGEHLLWRITRSDSGYIVRADIPPDQPGSSEAAARRYVIRKAVERTLPQEIFTGLRREHALSAAEADAVMRAVALEAIGRQPLRYLTSTARMSVELFFGDDQHIGEVSKRDGEPGYINPQSKQRTWFEDRILHLGEPPTQAVENEFGNAELLTSIYQPRRIVWLIALGFLIGAALSVFSRRHRPALLLALAIPPMLLANAALAGPEARFRYPLDPLIAVLAFGGLVWLAQVIWTAVRRRTTMHVPPESHRGAAET